MSVYANNNNITIYSIGFGQDLSAGGRETLRLLAESTGGKYYNASAADIENTYLNISTSPVSTFTLTTATSAEEQNVVYVLVGFCVVLGLNQVSETSSKISCPI
jgi:hypothetical protein